MTDSNENIPIEELADKHPISVRAYGICMQNGLITLNRLVHYYHVHKTFKELRGCGDKVEQELISLITNYRPVEHDPQKEVVAEIQAILPSYKDLTPFKKSTLNHHIDYLLSTLSVRALNSLNQQFGNSPTKTLLDKAIETNFDFRNIRNVGEKTVQELNSLRDKIKAFITTLRQLPDTDLSKEYTKLILKNTFPELSETFEQEIQGVFDESGKIKLFALINKLLSEGVAFNINEQKIFEVTYYSDAKSNKTLEQVATELQLTKERVRQLKNNLEDEIESYFSFIQNLNASDICNYEISNSSSLIVIDEEMVNSINSNENVQFTTVFYSIILGILLRNTHSVLGDDEVIHGKRKTKRGRKFRKCYLIEKTVFEIFNFEKFLEDVYLKLNDRITESYSIYFEGYILEFFSSQSLKDISRTKDICEQVLFLELDLIVDSNGFLHFERNTKKRSYEYVFEILEQSNRLMTAEEISEEINKKYPELEITEQNVRSCLREKELFIFIGRTSTYGLKKWEQEQENLKGGTIRDIVEEYLEMEDDPKHIAEIMTYVLKYRDTNEKNVLSNIKLEENQRFIFYEGGFIGIKGKNYSPESITFKKAVGTRFTKAFMSKFNNWDFDDVISFYVSNYGYTPIQIKYLFENKFNEGEIQIIDNKIIVP